MKVFVTGGTGTVGHLLVKRLLRDPAVDVVRVLGHSEHRALRFRQEFSHEPRVDVVLGDVADERDMAFKCDGIDVVYHLAALKHVDLVERDPYLAMMTNIEGTKNVVHASLQAGVGRFVLMSTDKVVHASSLYGATKLVAEKVTLAANRIRPIFNVFRSGNVLNSSGSVLEVWRRQLARDGRIDLTDSGMTRFIIEKERLADLLVGMPKRPAGMTLVPKSVAIRMSDLAKVFLELNGQEGAKVRTVGKRPGEKMHEELVSVEELGRTTETKDDYRIGEKAVKRPLAKVPSSKDHVASRKVVAALIEAQLAADGDLQRS